jgi:hypothetical protein
MSTAPRDGREIYAMRLGYLTSVTWDECGDDSCWAELGARAYDDDDLDGWLDIEALARDTARLDWLEKDAESCVVRGEAPNARLTTRFALVHAAFLVPNRPTVRAAIDKEMGNGNA